MSFNLAGFGLSMIVLTIVAGQIIAHKWIKKVTNCYFFWLGVGLFCFCWLVGFRFYGAWERLHDALGRGNFDPTGIGDAYILSKAVLLDICPFIGLMLPFSLIVDPTRQFARVLAPMGLITGLFTILCDIPTNNEPVFSATYIFIGTQENPCYFIMHALNLLLGVGVALNSPKFGWKGYLIALAAALLYYSYVGIMMGATKVSWYVSGLNLNDWTPEGEYHNVAEFLHCSPKVAQCVGLPFMFTVASSIIALNDYVFKNWIWTYGNARGKHWYSWYNYNKFDPKRIW